MKQQLQLVFQLNDFDLKIQKAEESLAKIPERRGEIETILEANRTLVSEKTNRFAALEKSKRDKEGEVELAESRLRDFQGKLSQIKTNKEYQAALKEIGEAKKSNKAIEDSVLELMTTMEVVKKEKEEAEAELQSTSEKLENEKRNLEVEEKKLEGMILEVKQERDKVPSQLNPTVLAQYQKIRKMRQDVVTFVEGGICQGCNMKIPPQLYIEIQKFKAIHTCPSCHRILYLPELTAGSGVKEVQP